MEKPLAIDLFCGLLQAQFVLRTDAAVEKFVAGRTKNPDHMRLSVRSKSPSSIALMRWPVCNLKNTIFTARLKRTRHFGPSTRKSVKCHIFETMWAHIETMWAHIETMWAHIETREKVNHPGLKAEVSRSRI